MRKFALVVLVCLSLTFTVSAQDEAPDLTTLASYFPSDSPAYFSLRTDDQMIETIDQLVKHVDENLPGLLPPDFDIKEGLDDIAASTGQDGDFESIFGVWLGDTVAIGALSMDMFTGQTFADRQPTVIFGVEDRDAAIAFLEGLSLTGYTASEEGDFWLYTPESEFGSVYMVGDDAMIITYDRDYLDAVMSGDFASLAETSNFSETVALLPAEYGAVGYLDASALYGSISESQMGFMTDSEQRFMEGFGEVAGQQAYGFGLLDNRNLVIDFAARLGDMSALDELGLGGLFAAAIENLQPIDTSFASYLPADAQIVYQGSGLGTQILNAFDAISAMGELMKVQAQSEMLDGGSTGAVYETLEKFDFGGLTKGSLILGFAGLTGLHLEDDVLNWMAGDYAGFASIIPVESEFNISLDFGFVTEATNPDAASAVVTAVTDALAQYELSFTTETVGDVETLVLPTRALLANRFSPEWLEETPEMDVMLGANQEVFVFATRPGFEAVLTPDDDTLADNPAYEYVVQNLIVSGAQQMYFINPQAAIQAINRTPFGDQRDMRPVLQALSMFESASISSAISAPNMTVGRLALTLTEPVSE